MSQVYSVRLFRQPRTHYYQYHDNSLQIGQGCIVESDYGLDFGEVRDGFPPPCIKQRIPMLRKIVRPMNANDWQLFETKIKKEAAVFDYCAERAQAHRLIIKLVKVYFTFDLNKVIIYYTAPGRIDFRQLVREIAKKFQTRVEMRQVGVRDEAKMMEGCGMCGKPLCCSSYLKEFMPVSMKMAKSQNLVLNPSKLSGLCGRLKCCLAYEFEEDQRACMLSQNGVE